MANLLSIFILILPWAIIPYHKITDPFRIPKSTLFDVLCLSAVCLVFFRGIKNRYFNKYIALFISWVFITIFFNWYLPYTLIIENNQRVNIATLEPTLHFILGTILFFICASSLYKDGLIKISKAICFSSILVCCIGILQKIGLDIFGKMAYYKEDNHFIAFLDHTNIIGNYLALSIPLFIFNIKNRFYKDKYFYGLLLIFVGVFLSRCNGAILASFIGIALFVLIYLRHKRVVIFSFLGLMSGGLLYCVINKMFIYNFLKLSNGFDGRMEVWTKAIEHIKNNPIFGQGLGIFKTWDIRNGLSPLYYHNAHSDWLEIVCQIGILGLVLLLFALIKSFRNFDYSVKNKLGIAYLCVFAEFIFIMLGSFPLNIAPLALTGIISLVAIEIL